MARMGRSRVMQRRNIRAVVASNMMDACSASIVRMADAVSETEREHREESEEPQRHAKEIKVDPHGYASDPLDSTCVRRQPVQRDAFEITSMVEPKKINMHLSSIASGASIGRSQSKVKEKIRINQARRKVGQVTPYPQRCALFCRKGGIRSRDIDQMHAPSTCAESFAGLPSHQPRGA